MFRGSLAIFSSRTQQINAGEQAIGIYRINSPGCRDRTLRTTQYVVEADVYLPLVARNHAQVSPGPDGVGKGQHVVRPHVVHVLGLAENRL